MALHKQNNNDGEIESETNEKMITKTWEGMDTCGIERVAFFLL